MSKSKLPAHGTYARYRLELRERKDGRGAGPCEKCREANRSRARQARVDTEARRRRSTMKLVDETTTKAEAEGNPGDDDTADDKTTGPGRMEAAVQKDIDEIDVALRVPFHHVLSELALDTAREIDDPTASASARSSARRQLFEVLKSLRTQGEGDDNSAVAIALEANGFGTPLVPGRPA